MTTNKPLRPFQRVFPAHDTDIQAGYARKDMHRTPCIHCGEIFDNSKVIYHDVMYTYIKNKVIWWHINPCCKFDPTEETI